MADKTFTVPDPSTVEPVGMLQFSSNWNEREGVIAWLAIYGRDRQDKNDCRIKFRVADQVGMVSYPELLHFSQASGVPVTKKADKEFELVPGIMGKMSKNNLVFVKK